MNTRAANLVLGLASLTLAGCSDSSPSGQPDGGASLVAEKITDTPAPYRWGRSWINPAGDLVAVSRFDDKNSSAPDRDRYALLIFRRTAGAWTLAQTIAPPGFDTDGKLTDAVPLSELATVFGFARSVAFVGGTILVDYAVSLAGHVVSFAEQGGKLKVQSGFQVAVAPDNPLLDGIRFASTDLVVVSIHTADKGGPAHGPGSALAYFQKQGGAWTGLGVFNAGSQVSQSSVDAAGGELVYFVAGDTLHAHRRSGGAFAPACTAKVPLQKAFVTAAGGAGTAIVADSDSHGNAHRVSVSGGTCSLEPLAGNLGVPAFELSAFYVGGGQRPSAIASGTSIFHALGGVGTPDLRGAPLDSLSASGRATFRGATALWSVSHGSGPSRDARPPDAGPPVADRGARPEGTANPDGATPDGGKVTCAQLAACCAKLILPKLKEACDQAVAAGNDANCALVSLTACK